MLGYRLAGVLERLTAAETTSGGACLDTTNLTWRDKVAIIDTTARIALGMFLTLVAFCELIIVVSG